MTGRTYDVMNMALPRKGFNGADRTEDTSAWKKSMAESTDDLLRKCRNSCNIKLQTLQMLNRQRNKSVSVFNNVQKNLDMFYSAQQMAAC